MLISPPFLPARGNQTEDQWLDAAMDGGQPGDGAFPLSFNLGWHGGVHLSAPPGAAGSEQVRAIADGTVVYLRQPTARVDDLAHPQNYRGGWTDNGCVVIRHVTEIGHAADATVTFFSIVMHLDDISPALANGRAVLRKAALGRAGRIYGGTERKIHFEIVCDEANLRLIAGRVTGNLPTNAHGRNDVVFGEKYFYLPGAHATMDRDPIAYSKQLRAAQATARRQRQPVPNALPNPPTQRGELTNMVVGVRYDRGAAVVTIYHPDGSTVRDSAGNEVTPANLRVSIPNAEYGLYDRAGDVVEHVRSATAPGAPVPAPSAVHELLRLGRIVNTAEENLRPATTPFWQQINNMGAIRWVDLNAAGVQKFSDADFPHWKGWKLIADDADGNSQCNSPTIKRWLDSDGNSNVVFEASPESATPREARVALATEVVRQKLKFVICKFPTEWEGGATSIENRFGWLKTATAENVNPMSETSFIRLRDHINALAFWASANTGIVSTEVWHFHPKEFVRLFRRNAWITDSDLSRIYPLTPANTRARYRLALNQVLRRYGFNQPLRSAHFFGQGLVETMGLQLMVEGSVSFARNPGHASFQAETNGYYADPLDLYGYFHNYERAGNDLGNVDRSALRDSRGNPLPVVIGRDARNRPLVTSPTVGQIDAGRSQVGDGMKFRGRGFKQLTGRSNYSKYWVFRGWLQSGVDFDENWWVPPRRPTDPAPRPPPIADPQRLSVVPFNCIDSGGQFAAKNDIPQQADTGVTRASTDRVSTIVNRYDAPSFGRRFDGTTHAYEIVGP
jgi:predicted chitinase